MRPMRTLGLDGRAGARLGQALAPALASEPEALSQLLSFDNADVAVALVRRWRAAHDAALVVFGVEPSDRGGSSWPGSH
jgi:hypothetical protein